MAVQVKAYENRKEVKRVQISMDRAEAESFVAGDKEFTKTLKSTIKEALATK